MSEEDDTDTKRLKDRRYIRYEYIDNYIGDMLTDIANGLLYVRNIPPTYPQGRTIDAARFVMITTAFEWEVQHLYPKGIIKKKKTIDAENAAEEALNNFHREASGKLKKIYQSLLNKIRFAQLSARIIHTGKELGSVIDPFGKRVYHLNDQELKYLDMGLRLGKQRNNYAHGNLD